MIFCNKKYDYTVYLSTGAEINYAQKYNKIYKSEKFITKIPNYYTDFRNDLSSFHIFDFFEFSNREENFIKLAILLFSLQNDERTSEKTIKDHFLNNKNKNITENVAKNYQKYYNNKEIMTNKKNEEKIICTYASFYEELNELINNSTKDNLNNFITTTVPKIKKIILYKYNLTNKKGLFIEEDNLTESKLIIEEYNDYIDEFFFYNIRLSPSIGVALIIENKQHFEDNFLSKKYLSYRALIQFNINIYDFIFFKKTPISELIKINLTTPQYTFLRLGFMIEIIGIEITIKMDLLYRILVEKANEKLLQKIICFLRYFLSNTGLIFFLYYFLIIISFDIYSHSIIITVFSLVKLYSTKKIKKEVFSMNKITTENLEYL